LVLGLVVALAGLATATSPGPSAPATAGTTGGEAVFGSLPYQKGMNIWSWTPDGYAAPAMRAALRRLVSDGVTWVDLVPTWFQPTATSADIAPLAGFTPTDAAITSAVAAAHNLGLHVVIKPQLNLADGDWRGSISPADPGAWWGAYDRFIVRYARLAARTGANELVVGTELVGVSQETSQWEHLIAAVRLQFHGLLTYAALPQEYHRIGFWGDLDFIGLDAYWELADAPTTNVRALVQAWQPILAQLGQEAVRWARPVVFTEAGYASQVGTATDPSSWTLSATPAPAQQAAAYSALLDALAGRRWARGVNWWAWRQDNESPATDFTPEGKPAELILRAAWAPSKRARPSVYPVRQPAG